MSTENQRSATGIPVAIGGLMRCCLASIELWLADGGTDAPGTALICAFEAPGVEASIVSRDGAWRWVGMNGLEPDEGPAVRVTKPEPA